MLHTVLNLIQKQQAELEKKDKILNDAYAKANNYLYFADSADYEVALWEVIRSLRPDLAEKMGQWRVCRIKIYRYKESRG